MRGHQEPRISLVPAYVSSAGEEAIELAAVAGLFLDPWQQLALIGASGERADGRWAAFEVGLGVARQNGKDSILEARELAGLFVFGERLIIHSAHKFDTAMEHLERLSNLIETAELQRRIRKVNRSHGSEGITLKDGRRIRFRARTTSGGGRGYTGDCVIFNEAMDLPDSIVGAMMPMMAARSTLRPGPQIWYAGSAVDQQTMANGLVLARLREAALAGVNERLAYFEHSAGVREWLEARGLHWDRTRSEIEQISPEMLADPELWAQANPGLGIRITPEYVLTEFNSPAMSLRQFAVERLGIGDWPETGEDAGRIIDSETWRSLAESDQEKRVTSREVFAIDTNSDQTWGSIGVSGQRDDDRWQVHVVKHQRGKDWIVPACVKLHEDHPDARFIVDPGGPASNLIGDLRDAGIDPIETSTRDYGDACADFVAGAVEDALRYPAPQPELSASVADARKQSLGDRWKWSRKNSTSADISPLVACTLALWGAQNAESEFATVLYGSDEAPVSEDPEIGPSYHQVGVRPGRVITQDEYTTCFACAHGECPVHGDG